MSSENQSARSRILLPLLALSAIGMSIYALTLEPPASGTATPEEAGNAGSAQRVASENSPDGKQRQDAATAIQQTVDPAQLKLLETDRFVARFAAENTGLASFELKDPLYRRDDRAIDVVTTDKLAYLPMSIRLQGMPQVPTGKWNADARADGSLVFDARVEGFHVSRKLEAGEGPYQIWSTVTVTNKSNETQKVGLETSAFHYAIRELEEGGFIAARSPYMSNASCLAGEEFERFERDEVLEDRPAFRGEIHFASVGDVYFGQAIAARDLDRCALSASERGGVLGSPHGTLLSAEVRHASRELPPGEQATFRELVYIGPKIPKDLRAAGHGLARVTEVGGIPGVNVIAGALESLLSEIHSYVGNWGLAIILLTLVVKLVLYPLTAKSFKSMAGMRRLKPEIDALNARLGDDRQRKGEAMMALYKEHQINPLGGCLPQLLQLPIWWALYMSLSTNVELFKQPFVFWWQDLTSPDPYYVLPLGLGLLMWVQQRLTPSTMDPAQAKMMLYLMPSMITAFMLFLPAGLCLYMFTNSALTIGQQRIIEMRLNRDTPAATSTAGDDAATIAKAESKRGASRNKIKPASRRSRRGRA